MIMKKTAAIFLALIICLCSALPAFAIDDPDFVEYAEKEKGPLVYLTDIEGKVGSEEKVTAKLLFANAEGFTGGDFVIQYNPYMLEYAGFKPSEAMSNSNVYITYTEKTGPDVLDIYGNVAHEVYISLIHMDEFPATLASCEIGTVSFKPIGSGECPLELTAMSYDISGKDAKVAVRGATATIESGNKSGKGDEASEWDYTAITSQLLQIPEDAPYVIEKPSNMPTWAIVLIIVGAVAVLAGVVLFVIRGKSYVADDGERFPSNKE